MILSLTIFCFLPMIISSIALSISIFNLYLLNQIKNRANIIDDNIVEIMRMHRDEYYNK